ncbi:alanyl-tRNA editing protein [Obesumbacterium proteus]|uniref:alanyl-tRNA editing protein n=1 Tax=Obesumbacterium proteus TaxID=82983 RepID=UPI00103333F6|nr:alanyl-tRNA editing protein [Obesumbacterium proteus]TBL72345.1 alanyl-tRNA editing protein [Obesumbacterium proteus]
MKTKRLFESYPYSDKFTAKIVYIGDDLGEDYIILDKTLFYPNLGGQVSDSGSINNVIVNHVGLDDDNNSFSDIRHYMDVSYFQVGQSVLGCIDTTKRLSIMRLHSARHIVESILSQWKSYIFTGSSLVSDKKASTDYLMWEDISSESLRVIELQANNFIHQSIPISAQTEKSVRYWVCGTAKTKCCGTHVGNTAEISTIKLSIKNKGKGINRIEIRLLDE